MRQLKVADALEKIINGRQLRVKDLAKLIGVSSACLCQWKSGKTRPKLHNLLIIEQLAGVSLRHLYPELATSKQPQPKNCKYQQLTARIQRMTPEHIDSLTELLNKLENDYKIKKVIELIALCNEIS